MLAGLIQHAVLQHKGSWIVRLGNADAANARVSENSLHRKRDWNKHRMLAYPRSLRHLPRSACIAGRVLACYAVLACSCRVSLFMPCELLVCIQTFTVLGEGFRRQASRTRVGEWLKPYENPKVLQHDSELPDPPD